jgi:hypothetical protein
MLFVQTDLNIETRVHRGHGSAQSILEAHTNHSENDGSIDEAIISS